LSQDIEQYRNLVRGSQNAHALGIYYMGKALLEELGEEKGTEKIVQQTKEMGQYYGTSMKKAIESQGKDNEINHYYDRSTSPSNIFAFAWEGGTKSGENDELILEWTYCPIADGFKKAGDLGVKIGELFCDNIDNAEMQAYNSDYECIRESSLNLNGLCRLHFKLKD